MSSPTEKMEILKKCKVIRSQVTRFTNDADKLLSSTSAIDLDEVSALIERLRLVERQLKDTDTAIEPHLKEEDAEAEYETVLEYSDRIATYIVRLELRKNSASQKETTSHENPVVRTQRTKLPKLELLKFDSRRRNWQPSWEQFDVAISKNQELSNLDRFNYLKSLLTGEAAAAIAGLQATSQCYEDAIDILQKRFGDSSALIQDHMQGLIDINPVSSEKNVHDLRRMLDSVPSAHAWSEGSGCGGGVLRGNAVPSPTSNTAKGVRPRLPPITGGGKGERWCCDFYQRNDIVVIEIIAATATPPSARILRD
ncbi:hypothetical protein HPB50_018527 [Hyalomma asiaticum]|uniref:Uncharacterized protein n=1 Tax=Hyalomma asiaticum TaxID=266040 RepID=A0ACB7TII7_HYAAI|nr:hypothetical protein HPB50_018527 [Hyalomma asiaticum]